MKKIILSCVFTGIYLCGEAQKTEGWSFDTSLERQVSSIDTPYLWQHIRALSHDSMQGRRPGTQGEALTIQYLQAAFKEAGLTPAYQGSFLQPVDLLRLSTTGTISFQAGEKKWMVPDSAVILRHYSPAGLESRDMALYFAGYGIHAPEYGWDDYKGADVKGKVVVVLEGEPSVFRKQRDSLNINSHHGFLFAKEHYARQAGASGIIVLFPYEYFYESEKWMMQDDYAAIAGENDPFFLAWVTQQQLLKLIDSTTLATWKSNAEDGSHTPVLLDCKVDVKMVNHVRPFTSYNVVGMIGGSDPLLRNECVVYTTHWDAFGVGLPVNGDSVYNGARDNAGGIAEMLAIAKAMSSMPVQPRRTVVFMATTSEEQGILGAEAYTRSPLFPLDKTVLAIGMDIFSPWGKTTGIRNEAYGYTDVDGLFTLIARRKGIPYRGPGFISMLGASDQYPFLKKEVPVVFASVSSESFTFSNQQRDSISKKLQSHSPDDEVSHHWDLRSAVEEARMLFYIGVTVANRLERPRWLRKMR